MPREQHPITVSSHGTVTSTCYHAHMSTYAIIQSNVHACAYCQRTMVAHAPGISGSRKTSDVVLAILEPRHSTNWTHQGELGGGGMDSFFRTVLFFCHLGKSKAMAAAVCLSCVVSSTTLALLKPAGARTKKTKKSLPLLRPEKLDKCVSL